MNKVTLSVVALAAIGAPVQAQAADQTEAEKLQATYDEVCGLLNTAINEVNVYHEAVKAEYLNPSLISYWSLFLQISVL